MLISVPALSQELNCKVSVNTQQINQTNKQVFKTLESSLQEFLNGMQWTSLKMRDNEKINCFFNIIVTSYKDNVITADIQIQSSRPVFNSAYETTLLNHQERRVSFPYLENEPIFFNESVFTSNLSSLVAYYAYMIIGFDMASFEENGGEKYFQKAFSVVLNAQNAGDDAWLQNGRNNRWQLASDLISEENKKFHKIFYNYHRLGLDKMADSPQVKEDISKCIINLKDLATTRFTSSLTQFFVNAKIDEIVQIFSAGVPIDTKQLQDALGRIAPTHTEKLKNIR